MDLIAPESGSIEVFGTDVARLTPAQRRAARRRMQIVFQDPTAALDPRMPVFDLLAEPLRIDGRGRAESRTPGARIARPRRVGTRARRALSRGLLRRPEAADQHRARPRPRPRVAGARRTRVVVGCVDPGGCVEPAASICRKARASLTFSFRTTCPSCATSHMTWRSCIGDGSWNSGRRRRCSSTRSTSTHKRCSPRCRQCDGNETLRELAGRLRRSASTLVGAAGAQQLVVRSAGDRGLLLGRRRSSGLR